MHSTALRVNIFHGGLQRLLTIYQSTPVSRITSKFGVSYVPDLYDLRAAAAAVCPFQSIPVGFLKRGL